MQGREYYDTHDFRWLRKGTEERVSWRETLQAMCDFYGQGAMRWHSHEYWQELKPKIASMTDEECESKVREIELEADEALETWEMYQ